MSDAIVYAVIGMTIVAVIVVAVVMSRVADRKGKNDPRRIFRSVVPRRYRS